MLIFCFQFLNDQVQISLLFISSVLLVRLLNISLDMGVVPMDWCSACIVPMDKLKGDKCECSNSREKEKFQLHYVQLKL